MLRVLSRKNTTGHETKFIYLFLKKEFNQLFFFLKKSLTKFKLDRAKVELEVFFLNQYNVYIYLKYERIIWINLMCFHSRQLLLYII